MHRDVWHGWATVAKLRYLKRPFGPTVFGTLSKEIPQGVEYPRLVVLEGNHVALTS